MSDDIFTPTKESNPENNRKAIRYSPSRKKATVSLKQLFNHTRHIHVIIINISSKGARFSSKYKFTRKDKIILNLRIKGKIHKKVPAVVVRLYQGSEYGISFDESQHEIIDKLISQTTDFSEFSIE